MGLPFRVVTANFRLGDDGFFLPPGVISPLSAGCCCDSASTTVGAARVSPGRTSAGLPGPEGPLLSPAFGPDLGGLDAIGTGAVAACFNRSATEGIRLAAMSFRICSISAHFSRWPTPNSGFRDACLTRSSPPTTSPDSRRPLSRSAAAWFSIRRRVSGRSRSSLDSERICLLVS